MIEVEHITTIHRPNYVVRTFKVTADGVDRDVTQFSFKAWPDHGCPASTAALLGTSRVVLRVCVFSCTCTWTTAQTQNYTHV